MPLGRASVLCAAMEEGRAPSPREELELSTLELEREQEEQTPLSVQIQPSSAESPSPAQVRTWGSGGLRQQERGLTPFKGVRAPKQKCHRLDPSTTGTSPKDSLGPWSGGVAAPFNEEGRLGGRGSLEFLTLFFLSFASIESDGLNHIRSLPISHLSLLSLPHHDHYHWGPTVYHLHPPPPSNTLFSSTLVIASSGREIGKEHEEKRTAARLRVGPSEFTGSEKGK